ncbi:hypothetical protein ACFWBB_30810 [Streptomyces sp. NPDC060000]|uniref:hypothetical protein n=1 Tax=Streptomyces sp. NPDC060000 TaxID=3347031 RepID=UPI0036B27F4A
MSNDVAEDPAEGQQSSAPSLRKLAVIGAVARAMVEHQKAKIQPREDAPREALTKAFETSKQPTLVVDIDGEEVGKYTVGVTKDTFQIGDPAAFEKFAEQNGELDIVIAPKPSFVKAMLARARRNPETGAIFDSQTGEEIPGVTFVPGGKPNGSVRWTWKTFRGQDTGKDVLMAALRSGRLYEDLKETPELLPKSQPGASAE